MNILAEESKKRCIRNGKVAVLYSPGFGAGWSSWCYDERPELKTALLFHPSFVELVEAGKRDQFTDEFVRATLGIGPEDYVCVLGADQLKIYWANAGCRVRIEEYDGSESVVEDSLDTSWVNT